MGNKLITNRKKISFLEQINRKLFLLIFKNSSTFRKYATEFVVKNNMLYGLSILNNVLEFYNCSVKDIMIPRAEIYAIDIDPSKNNLIDKVEKSNYTRIPIYKNNIDNIIGFVHIKDIVFNFDRKLNFKSIIRNVIYIPPSMKVVNLFIKMQSSHTHLAIVLDEYGCTEGLVSMVDIIEEIVGDMEDEHDGSSEFMLTKISEGKFEISARVLIREIEEALNIELRDSEDEDYVTINGLIFAMTGRVPLLNEVIKHKSGIEFLIKEANERCVHKLIIDLNGYNGKKM